MYKCLSFDAATNVTVSTFLYQKGEMFFVFNTFRSVVVNIQSNTANNLMPLEKMNVWVKSICRDVHILISECSKAILVLIWWVLL